MPSVWDSPLYHLKTPTGKTVTIDVTSSVSPGLKPHSAVKDLLIPFLKKRDVRSVLDFGGGSLRHTFPLLAAGFSVCGVEFEECFARPICQTNRAKAEKNPNFTALIWPRDFVHDKRKFDAALLCYVLQVMPLPKERDLVLKFIEKKLKADAYLLYMSRYNQAEPDDAKHQVTDGAYRYPDRDIHSFYTEFPTEQTHEMMEGYGFRRIRSLGTRGTEQVFLYAKGKGTWI